MKLSPLDEPNLQFRLSTVLLDSIIQVLTSTLMLLSIWWLIIHIHSYTRK